MFEAVLSSLCRRARFGGLVRFVDDLCIALEGELRIYVDVMVVRW